MNGLAASEIVALWEAYRRASATTRAVGLAAAATSCDTEEIAALPIGERDAAILRTRCATWGPRAPCHAACPRCAAELELELDLSAMVPAEIPPAEHALERDGVAIRFRVPTSADLWALERLDAAASPADELLARCVLSATRHGDPIGADRLPEALRETLADELSRLDPLADVELELSCAACRHAWVTSFDVADYVWREIDGEARRLLAIVDALARAYGWGEAEILALGPERRRFYLERVGVL